MASLSSPLTASPRLRPLTAEGGPRAAVSVPDIHTVPLQAPSSPDHGTFCELFASSQHRTLTAAPLPDPLSGLRTILHACVQFHVSHARERATGHGHVRSRVPTPQHRTETHNAPAARSTPFSGWTSSSPSRRAPARPARRPSSARSRPADGPGACVLAFYFSRWGAGAKCGDGTGDFSLRIDMRRLHPTADPSPGCLVQIWEMGGRKVVRSGSFRCGACVPHYHSPATHGAPCDPVACFPSLDRHAAIAHTQALNRKGNAPTTPRRTSCLRSRTTRSSSR